VCLAIFFAFFVRNSNSDKEIAGPVDDDDELGLSDDEQNTPSTEVDFDIFSS
jgi:hypothetical protein